MLRDLLNQSYRVLCYDSLSEYEETMAELTKLVSEDKNTHAWNNLGVACFEIGDFENALTNLDSAIIANPANYVAYINRAELNRKLKRLAAAEADYNEAIKLNPLNATYWRCRAYFMKDQNRLKQALHDFKEAMKIDPEFEATNEEIRKLEK